MANPKVGVYVYSCIYLQLRIYASKVSVKRVADVNSSGRFYIRPQAHRHRNCFIEISADRLAKINSFLIGNSVEDLGALFPAAQDFCPIKHIDLPGHIRLRGFDMGHYLADRPLALADCMKYF